ncbi:hypothetical protein [Streptomyces sp. NPDC060010]|uniref:hypothetical protein n=1 Tax=Streptomyces sp. NPDC060010 TaxID=3347036 RepID=UPI0036C66926
MSTVSIDSTTARAHHDDAAGIHLGCHVVTALEKAAAEEKSRPKGAAATNKPGRTPKPIPSGKSVGASGADANSG